MIEDLKDRVVLVTGSSTGIGAAAARAFGQQGARVAVHYNRSADAAQQVVGDIVEAGGAAIAFQADLTNSAAVTDLVDRVAAHFGRIDVLVNNAGDLVARRLLADIDDALFDQVMNLNARSVITACRAAVAHMRRQGSGNIINVTSVAARNGGGTGSILYAASKGFVSTATRALAKELAAEGIRVNAVAPGVITTPFQERHTSPAQMEGFRAAIPMQRLGTSDECAGAFLYLASDQMSGYVTGQVLEVNGGQLMP